MNQGGWQLASASSCRHRLLALNHKVVCRRRIEQSIWRCGRRGAADMAGGAARGGLRAAGAFIPHHCGKGAVGLSGRGLQQHLTPRLPSPALPLLCSPSQGIVGTAPWLALVFMTLYLQLLGMSDLQASLLMACFLGSSAAGAPRAWQGQAGIGPLHVPPPHPCTGAAPAAPPRPAGGLLGGMLGDAAAQCWPNHGRVAVCQISVAASVPLAAVLFKVRSPQPWGVAMHCTTALFLPQRCRLLLLGCRACR